WRCDTPLLAYARSSWYITMSKLRKEIQERNETIHWFPEHIRDGRFGEWLRELKDWAITRERYWGAPIPSWECDRCGEREILGSFAELIAKAPKRNRYLLMRHGEAESNVRGVISARVETSDRYPLTASGRARVAQSAERLKGAGITRIIASPFHRMRETAEIVSRAIGVRVEYDERLREFDIPDFDGKTVAEHRAVFPTTLDMYQKKVGANETWDELARRMVTTLKEIDTAHEGETILICSHGDPLFLLEWAYSGRTRAGIEGMPYPKFDAPHPFAFTGALVNDRGELDVHRPFIDGITWSCAKDGCGGTMRRFPEVVDVWLESGCMPFAQVHFPFERETGTPTPNSQLQTPAQYPADYISEAIDQTRGWFYTLLAVATVLGWDAPYRNVVVLGHLLDRQGKKMSKSKGNVVDPNAMIEKYGADVVRWYMCTVNQPWDAKRFDEADLKAMSGKPFGTLRNVLSFWDLHGGNAAPQWVSLRGSGATEAIPAKEEAGVHLDSWLRARFAALHHDVTAHLDAYEITEAARAIQDLIDDLSTWWLRRSRERLKEGEASARGTFTAALHSLATLLAPFAPFTAERLWMSLRGVRGDEAIPTSVHLASWESGAPPSADGDDALLVQMASVRRLCSLGLEARAEAGIPVRQALNAVHLYTSTPLHLNDALRAIVREELNVKAVVEAVAEGTLRVVLDTTITPELKREGMIRDLTRAVNNLRKESGYTPSDRIRVTYACDDMELSAAITEYRDQLLRGTNADAWDSGTPATPQTRSVGGATIVLDIVRVGA
ncbi:class I tRNA ligase family protein, partial [Candidatus Uhrbacteria bacterium]|nr:class I tRNA ligase family protein [Candidatus Uhrbacteria bacterium]